MTENWFPFNDHNHVKDCLEDFFEAYSDLQNKISSEKEKEELKQKEEIQRASKADTSN